MAWSPFKAAPLPHWKHACAQQCLQPPSTRSRRPGRGLRQPGTYLCLRCTQLSCESGTLHTRLLTAGTREMLGPHCFHFTVYMDEPPFAACLPVHLVRGCRGNPGPSLGRPGGFYLPAQPQPRDMPAGTCTQQLAVTHHRRPDRWLQPVTNSNIRLGCSNSGPQDTFAQRLREDTISDCMSSVLQIGPFSGTCGEQAFYQTRPTSHTTSQGHASSSRPEQWCLEPY